MTRCTFWLLCCFNVLLPSAASSYKSYIFKYDLYNIECVRPVISLASTQLQCAIQCSLSTCAGYMHDLATGECLTCPGHQVTNLTFGSNTYKLRKTVENVNMTNMPLPNPIPLGTVFQVSIYLANDVNYFIELVSMNIEINLYFRRSGEFTYVNAIKDVNAIWPPEIPLFTLPVHPLDVPYDHLFLIAEDGFHIYLDGAYVATFPHQINTSVIKAYYVIGSFQNVTISY